MRLVLALVFVVACGSDGGGGGGGDGGGGGGSDGGGSGGSGDAAMPTRAGALLFQSYDAMNTPSTSTRGGVAAAELYASGAPCSTMQTIGPCVLLDCTGAAPALVSAGTITFAGAAEPVTLTPDAGNAYTRFMTSAAPLFAGGDSITVAASGADVPAFSTSLVMPGKTTITSPAKPTPQSPQLNINRTLDLTLQWTGSSVGKVQIGLNDLARHTLLCGFDASAGMGTIPSAALMTLPAGLGSFGIDAVNVEIHAAGDWGVKITGLFNSVWPDNSIVSGGTNLQ